MNLLGDLSLFGKDPLAAVELAAARPSHHLRMGPVAIRLLIDPAEVHAALTAAPDSIGRDAIALAAARKLLGEGIATTEYARHREHRRAIKGAFAEKIITEHHAIITSEAERAIIADGRPLAARLERFGIRVTTRLLLASDLEETAHIEQAAAAFHESMRAEFRSPVQAVLPDWLPTSLKRATRAAKRGLRIAVDEVLAASVPRGDDVPSMMSRFPNSTPALVASQTTNLLVAGSTTTLPFLEWMIRYLSTRPDLVGALRSDFEAMSGRIMRETLRLAPPAWLFGRQAREAIQTPALTLRRGEIVYLCPYLTHRLPGAWDAPNEFRPERWETQTESDLPRGAFFPFAAGAHACLGERLVYMEGRAILQALLAVWPEQARIEHDGFRANPGFTFGAAGQTTLIKV